MAKGERAVTPRDQKIVEDEGAGFAFPSQTMYIEALASEVETPQLRAKEIK